jgi:hypothetical protein
MTWDDYLARNGTVRRCRFIDCDEPVQPPRPGRHDSRVCEYHARVIAANPWAGRRPCPLCDSDEWTLPIQPGEPEWRCVDCHITFVVPEPDELDAADELAS